MILEKQKEAFVVTDGDEVNESIGMSLDLDSAQILMQMLSKNLYSDPIGSTVRECASNALDSHRRAGTDDPIIVSFKLNELNNYEFSVEDFGIGLDAEDVKNIISKYGKSTKRNSTTELGMMGLGFKAPLAYSSSFYFICRKNGVERKYMMYEGEDVNTIDLMYEKPTEERNGVKVIVPVKWGDRDSFFHKIEQQLSYFENVYFDVVVGSHVIPNDFTIYRSKDFQISQLSKDNKMHICLDNVYYPLDFSKLDFDDIVIPIGLRFSLSDGIYPTPNREAIRYTTEAKETIRKKIEAVADDIFTKMNTVHNEFEDFRDVHTFYSENKRVYEITPGIKVQVNQLMAFSAIKLNPPKLKGVKHLNLERLSNKYDDMFAEYSVRYILNRHKFKEVKITSWEAHLSRRALDSNSVYVYTTVIPEIKKAYFRQHLSSGYRDNHLFVKKGKEFSLFPRKGESFNTMRCYYNLLGLSNIKKEHWREAIQEFQGIIEKYVSRFISVDDYQIPQQFLDRRKLSISKKGIVRRQKMEGDIIVKVAVPLERYIDGKNCKFVTDTWKLKDIPKMHRLVIYSNHDNASKLDDLYKIISKHRISLITLSKRELKALEELEIKNIISYEKFMEGKTKLFTRLVTAELIKRLSDENGYLFRRTYLLDPVTKRLSNDIDDLNAYINRYYVSARKEVYDAMIEVATNLRLFDFSIYEKYVRVKAELEKAYFLNTYIGMMPAYGDQSHHYRILKDLFLFNNVKMNKECYKKPKVLTEEAVEELMNE